MGVQSEHLVLRLAISMPRQRPFFSSVVMVFSVQWTISLVAFVEKLTASLHLILKLSIVAQADMCFRNRLSFCQARQEYARKLRQQRPS